MGACPQSWLSLPPGNLPQPPTTASFLFIKPATACSAADGDGAKGASLPPSGTIAWSQTKGQPSGQGHWTESTPRASLAAATSRLYHGSHTPVPGTTPILAELLSNQFPPNPSSVLCCHDQRCCSCRILRPFRLPDTLSLPCSILSNSQITNP